MPRSSKRHLLKGEVPKYCISFRVRNNISLLLVTGAQGTRALPLGCVPRLYGCALDGVPNGGLDWGSLLWSPVGDAH